MSVNDHAESFTPAETTKEATDRIFSLTGATSQARGEKRALVALRDALDLDVDVVRTNVVLARAMAAVMDVEWRAESFEERNRVNLAGLNVLLEGATTLFRAGSLKRLRGDLPPGLDGPEWAAFQPAVSKIEAVTRIARLTDSPEEWLGPGSKEHKSVLINLADSLIPDAPLDRSSKTRMARDMAETLGVPWTDQSYSTGETIQLVGLNSLLAGAERLLGRLGTSAADLLATPEAEGHALAAALKDGWPSKRWDGRECIEWMHKSGVRGANENEWQGWYFEARGRQLLNASFPPSKVSPQTRFGNTSFDYALNRVWDLKAHTEERLENGAVRRDSRSMLLNDERAMRACIATQGLGFLVLGGLAVMDDGGEFVQWHRRFKEQQRKQSAPSNSGKSRTRKRAFAPLRVESFWIADTPALDAAFAAGSLAVRPIGRQAPREQGVDGAPRANKLEMRVTAARKDLRIAEFAWR